MLAVAKRFAGSLLCKNKFVSSANNFDLACGTQAVKEVYGTLLFTERKDSSDKANGLNKVCESCVPSLTHPQR